MLIVLNTKVPHCANLVINIIYVSENMNFYPSIKFIINNKRFLNHFTYTKIGTHPNLYLQKMLIQSGYPKR